MKRFIRTNMRIRECCEKRWNGTSPITTMNGSMRHWDTRHQVNGIIPSKWERYKRHRRKSLFYSHICLDYPVHLREPVNSLATPHSAEHTDDQDTGNDLCGKNSFGRTQDIQGRRKETGRRGEKRSYLPLLTHNGHSSKFFLKPYQHGKGRHNEQAKSSRFPRMSL